METITSKEFRAEPGVEDWRTGLDGASATFTTGDFATGTRLFNAISELAEAANHHPDVEVKYSAVRVTLFTHSAHGLTMKDVALARQISHAASELGIGVDTARPQRLMIAVATPDAGKVMPFWQAVTGYRAMSDRELVDPAGRGPLIWMQEIDKPLRGRMHIDIVVAAGTGEERVAAALAAGGVMADDSHAPRWWTLADADGHKVDITPRQ